MPALAVLPIEDGGVRRNPVVPNNDSARLPLHAHLQVSTERDVVVQELEQIVALLLLEANDAAGELEGFLSACAV